MLHPLRFAPALAWAAMIFWLSAQTKLPEPPVAFDGLDKLAHASVYAALCLLLLGADRAATLRRVALWVGVAALYGLSDELHQILVPSRHADVWDLLADFGGALLAGGGWLWARRYAVRRHGALGTEPR